MNIKKYRVLPGSEIDFNTDAPHHDEDHWKELRKKNCKEIRRIQERLYAQEKHSVLICLQGMDTAGKDSLIRRVIGPLNPAGVHVHAFKRPTEEELSHDYLWRHHKKLPPKGFIGVFNRTHYENVLVTRVHPEINLNLQLPNIHSVDDIDEDFWAMRYRQINQAEKTWVENGMIVIKFYLNISPETQKDRLMERLNNPEKHWKFEAGDLKERKYWKDYMTAYEEMLQETSFKDRPWYVIPSDFKPYSRYLVSEIILRTLEKYDIDFPESSKEVVKNIEKYKKELNKIDIGE
ncbi:MAG: polyphosphate kinase 2 family protein [Flavobacteriales bacterium]|jgi:PPK2 family polyphosphate:nucleotide phosphotransferase|nr:polyphosphate kinase 2 family protein [Flavobacteriales bacterium]